MNKECIVFRRKRTLFDRDYEYSTTLTIEDDSMLEKIKEALKPFGYTFRFPKR